MLFQILSSNIYCVSSRLEKTISANTFKIIAPPYEDTTPPKNIQYGGQKYYKILNLRIVPLVISAVGWVKWTKKYERYKKLQEQVNKKLDDSNNGQN